MQSRTIHVGWQSFTIAAALIYPTAAMAAMPFDQASLEFGSGPNVRLVRLGLQSEWMDHRWFEGNGRHAFVYGDVTVARWRGDAFNNVSGSRQYITDIGVTPVLRYGADDHLGWYGEAGIGAHLLSHVLDNDGKHLSTAFQFGDHLGAGYVFGGGWDLGLKFQHFSNAGIKEPNSGVNFVMVKLAKRF